MFSPLNHSESCTFITKTEQPDGMGGTETVWAEGKVFQALIYRESSPLVKIAEQQGVSSSYNISVDKDLIIPEFSIFKRMVDGQHFRVTSNALDRQTPSMSLMDFKVISAEKYKLPTD